ncbi:hypothetical protein BDQ17DRAFT_1333397 [Cyathus striatus]|nr:hypothetical protein BDQ17DRAFT_1333397 [Cyathus striatus]
MYFQPTLLPTTVCNASTEQHATYSRHFADIPECLLYTHHYYHHTLLLTPIMIRTLKLTRRVTPLGQARSFKNIGHGTVELTSPIHSPQLPSIRLLPSYSEIQNPRSLLGSEIQEPLRSLMVGRPTVDTSGKASGLNTKDYLSATRVDQDSVTFRNNDNRVYHSHWSPPLPVPPISSILRSTLATRSTARDIDHPEQHNARVEAVTSRVGSLMASDSAAESPKQMLSQWRQELINLSGCLMLKLLWKEVWLRIWQSGIHRTPHNSNTYGHQIYLLLG